MCAREGCDEFEGELESLFVIISVGRERPVHRQKRQEAISASAAEAMEDRCIRRGRQTQRPCRGRPVHIHRATQRDHAVEDRCVARRKRFSIPTITAFLKGDKIEIGYFPSQHALFWVQDVHANPLE